MLDELLHFVFERGSATPPPSLALYENGGQEVDEMVERFFLSFFFNSFTNKFPVFSFYFSFKKTRRENPARLAECTDVGALTKCENGQRAVT